ncbi:hypothetical protein M0802_010859 [Mischocyttarus mexicanus]|nr:hypothetical protein M0802_010859 [Mischocyttarus mexicanus]
MVCLNKMQFMLESPLEVPPEQQQQQKQHTAAANSSSKQQQQQRVVSATSFLKYKPTFSFIPGRVLSRRLPLISP